jgi:tetratricopeptide (TPR) repeat protein
LAFVIARWLGVLPFFVCDRFRVAAVPFMLPFAGYAVAGAWLLYKGKQVRPLAWAGVVLVAAAVFVNVDWFGVGRGDLSREHFFLGKIHLERGAVDDGERELLAANEIGESADAWVMLSFLRLQRRDFEGAAQAARECLRLAPDTPTAHGNLASALLATGHAEEALTHADEAVRLEPSRALHRLARANVLIGLDRKEDARRDLDAVRELPLTPPEYEHYRRLAALVGK